ncbi:MAG: NAD+ synthase [Candidatus Ratteibacteria bacterium]|nr:NAD+ synthase [Candidatus Ratteibacteria bacterium]
MQSFEINPLKVKKQLVEFIKEEVDKRGFSKVVIGLSGGIDSTVAAYLAVKALGKDNVIGLLLPYGKAFITDLTIARLAAENLKIETKEIDISAAVDAACFLVGCARDKVGKGNIMARIRMIILYDRSRFLNALVLGTGNRSESLLGYCTLWGDMACAIAPLGSLYKTQVYTLANHLGIPQTIIKKPPSAGLWEGQIDEDELGVTYKEADRLLYFMVDKKYNFDRLRREGFQSSFIYRVKSILAQAAFKRQWPAVPKRS